MQERLVVLDVETTGMEVEDGHRIVEIACVELLNRRVTQREFHCHLNPERDIDDGAVNVHGLTRERLADEPRFAEICDAFLDFVKDAVVVIHHAPFDLAFIDEELRRAEREPSQLESHCAEIIDSLVLARKTPKEDGTRRGSNTLQALCKEFDIDTAGRTQLTGHEAIVDVRLLAEVYLRLTTRQDTLTFAAEDEDQQQAAELGAGLPADRPPLKVIKATPEETAAHNRKLAQIEEASKGKCIWLHQKEA